MNEIIGCYLSRYVFNLLKNTLDTCVIHPALYHSTLLWFLLVSTFTNKLARDVWCLLWKHLLSPNQTVKQIWCLFLIQYFNICVYTLQWRELTRWTQTCVRVQGIAVTLPFIKLYSNYNPLSAKFSAVQCSYK